jgi:hypothetical protein
MKRRDVLKISAGVAAVPVLLPAQSGPAKKHEAHAAAAGAKAVAQNWKPAILTADQNQTIIVLTDLIIPATDTPGAKAALVNRYIDLLLKDGPASERERFLGGLKWFDEYSVKRSGSEFRKLSQADQIALLKTLSEGTEAGIEPGHEFFRMMKNLTSRVYYATDIGFRELNKGGRVPGTFACEHSGSHA